MPRSARKLSNSGIYHVMLRGINHQQIFEDEEDNMIFIKTLKECKEKCGYKILAYCLMGNHVHLLIRNEDMELGQIFKHIGVRYVHWYNTKYERTGHLFQDRFKSEPVEDDAYLITVIRYIHQNPVKAGICRNPEEYPYSSIHEYQKEADIVDVSVVEQFVSKSSILEIEDHQPDLDCMDIEAKTIVGITDEKAKDIMRKQVNVDNPVSFQTLSNSEQQKCITKLRMEKASIRQISRLTGITLYRIRKLLNCG